MGAYTCQFGFIHKTCRCPTHHSIRCDKPETHGPQKVTLPESVCLIWWNVHEPHDWWATDEGGGHMVYAEFANPNAGDKEYHCPGVTYVPKHRGVPTGKWVLPKTHGHVPRRRRSA